MSRFLLFVGLVCFLSISTAHTAEAQRSGFIIGFGVGPGFTAGDVDSKVGIATDFRIGGTIGKSLQLYYTAKSNLLFYDGDPEASAVSGLGATYAWDSGFNINGTAGLATWLDFDNGTSNGFGAGAGVGYEFADRWVFNVGGTFGVFEGDKVFNVAATISFLSH